MRIIYKTTKGRWFQWYRLFEILIALFVSGRTKMKGRNKIQLDNCLARFRNFCWFAAFFSYFYHLLQGFSSMSGKVCFLQSLRLFKKTNIIQRKSYKKRSCPPIETTFLQYFIASFQNWAIPLVKFTVIFLKGLILMRHAHPLCSLALH